MEEEKKAKNYAYHLLSYRWYSRKELEKSLEKKGFNQDVIDNILEQLERENYLNDQRFAENWLNFRGNNKLLGKKRLQYELREKGISSNLLEQELDSFFTGEKEFSLALQAAQKKANLYQNMDKEKYLRRMTNFLVRKGFTYDLIKKVLNKLEEEGREE